MPIDPAGVINYNQKFIDTAEHFDEFIQNRARKHPNIWFDRIPKGALTMFEGLVRQTNIFHGGLGEQAGLTNWNRIQISRKPAEGDAGFDACNYDPKTFNYAWESRQFTGWRASWQSEPICITDIVYVEQGRQQAAMITSFLSFITMSVWENWNREQYVQIAEQAGNAFILTEGGIDYDDASLRFEYDPYSDEDFGDTDRDTFIRFPASINISTLNWSYFDWWQDYLGDEVPEAAVSMQSGLPIFALMIHKRDFDKMILNDAELREDMRFARSEVLFDDYRKFNEFKGWGIVHDSRQMRFKFARMVNEEFKSVTQDVVYAKRVKPFREGRAGTIGNIPEANPDYHNAELAIGVVFMNQVLQNLIPTPVANLGGGMIFGAQPSFNGNFQWINEYDRELNPLREVGFYFARFQAFPKPLLYSFHAIVFLYRRCPQTWSSDCNLACDGDPSTVAVALERDAVAGDVDATNTTITVDLADCIEAEVGDSVTIDAVLVSAGTYPATSGAVPAAGQATWVGTVAEDALAPTYVIAFEPGSTVAAADFLTTTTVIKTP